MATIGLTMIVRGAESTLPACLDSVKDYLSPIVVVLAGTPTDDTEAVARRYTEHVYHYEDDLLPDGGISDFAAARNFSLAKLAELTGPDAWFMWVDADDTVDHPEAIADLVQEAQKRQAQCVWLPYLYGFTDNGACTTLHDRERIMYDPTFWCWQHRVHEVVAPQRPVHHMRSERVQIRHAHRESGSRTDRNLALLRLMYEEDPGNERTLYYFANQYFAAQDWAKAVEWFERHVAVATNTLEKWQSFVYMAKACRQLGRIDDALSANMAALAMFPDFRDSWFDLAETYAYKGDFEHVLMMAEIGKKQKCPPRLLFVNPLDEVGHTVGKFEQAALYHTGDLEGALAKVQELRAIESDEYLEEQEAKLLAVKEARDTGNAWITVLDRQEPEKIVELAPSIPEKLFTFPEVRDAVFTAKLSLARREKGKRIAFYCGPTLESWAPPSLNEGGIGGSETACIEIARRFARDGWKVDVFNDCGKHEGEHEGVRYWDHKRFDHLDPVDVLVSWRQPELVDQEQKAKAKLFWGHDLTYGERLTAERCQRYDRILGVSEYHRDYLGIVYPFIEAGRLGYVPNGVDLKRFENPGTERPRHKVVYISSPDRGLDILLSLWPKVMEAMPDAELHVFYGFNNLEKMARTSPESRWYVEAMRRHMDKPGVKNRGRVGQDKLAQELMSASVLAYPTHFLETFMIGGVEAMAAGTVVVASAVGAIPYVVGDIDGEHGRPGAGLLVPGHAGSDWYMNEFLGTLFCALLDEETWHRCHNAGLERAKLFTWDKAYEKWKEIIGELGVE
jgi:glycosyltransferase involved in cell wall biosynthesis